MALLKTEEAYNAAMQRIEELLKIVTDETPTSDSRYLELDFLSDLVEEYENIHYPMGKALGDTPEGFFNLHTVLKPSKYSAEELMDEYLSDKYGV